jgi:hypothetical protein
MSLVGEESNMVTFSGYWTSAAFTDRYGQIGWVEEPRKRTWDTTRRWCQIWTWCGPSDYTETFLNLLSSSDQHTSKAYQRTVICEGPTTRVAATWYSDDYDGRLARDPLITTWSMSKNVGSQSILYSDKSRYLFNPVNGNLLVRIAVAAQAFKAAVASQQQQLATTGRRPRVGLVQLMNDCFTDFVVTDPTSGVVYTDLATTNMQWHASQLYRLICRGVTTSPFSQYVLTKTQVCFPPATLESGAQIGTGVRTSYERIFYAFSTKALQIHEPELNDQFASLLSVGQFPITWWVKQPPDVQQTSDSRWQIVQHYYGVRQFEPFITPWVKAPSETFVTGQFDPGTWSDSPASGEANTNGLYGVKDGTCVQWSTALQSDIFGGNQTYIEL